MSYSLLSGLITNFYTRTTPAEENKNSEIDLNELLKQVEKMHDVEIKDFTIKLSEMIKNVRLSQLSRELENFKIYFHSLLKEFAIDTSKSTFLEIEELEKRRKKLQSLEDTETVKVFKIIMTDYKSIVDNDLLTLEKVQYFAKFLNREIDEYDSMMFIKFIDYGNKHGGWRNYNYNTLNLNELI